MSNVKKVDVAIIGAGTSGMGAYRKVSQQTDSVVLIEAGDYGTTCARVGCMPSKLLIAAAEVAELGSYSKQFGVSYEGRSINGRAVMQRVRSERDRFVGFVLEAVASWPAEHLIKGYAKFTSDNTLEIDDGTMIEAKSIVIATGSRPNIFPDFAALGDRLIVNDDVFSWECLPNSVAVVGAGVVGLELGQALHRLGVRVTLFGRDGAVGPLTDPEIKTVGAKIFKDDFNFLAHAEIVKMNRGSDSVEISYCYDGEDHTGKFEYVLAATGRRPNVDKLGLENTSIKIDERGVPEFDINTARIGDTNIFIAGDVNNVAPLLHEASDEGQMAGYNAINLNDVRSFKKSSPIGIVFSDPQIMMVGQTHNELIHSNIEFDIGQVDWTEQGRSRVMLLNKGLLRVYGERGTGRFLGAEMVGPRAEHLAHLLAWSHQSNLTVSEMLERPFYHPVFEEGLRGALRDLNHTLKMGAKPPVRCLDCGPGA